MTDPQADCTISGPPPLISWQRAQAINLSLVTAALEIEHVSLCRADGLVLNPPACEYLPKGGLVEFLPF